MNHHRAQPGPGRSVRLRGSFLVYGAVDVIVGHVGDIQAVEDFGHPEIGLHAGAVQLVQGVAVAALDLSQASPINRNGFAPKD